MGSALNACALVCLSRHGALTPRELGIREEIQKSTVTKLIAALEANGLISRRCDPSRRLTHVSERRRQAVLEAVAELGYRPDPSARSLAERRTRTVGVVIDDLSNPLFLPLLEGLRPVLHEHALRPLLADGRYEPDAVNAMAPW